MQQLNLFQTQDMPPDAATLNRVWDCMHSDFKLNQGGERKVLVMRGGTTLVPLNELTAAEIDRILTPYNRRST